MLAFEAGLAPPLARSGQRLGTAIRVSERAAGALGKWNEQVAEHVHHIEHYLMELDPEHSLWTESPDCRYFGVTMMRLKPDVYYSFADALTRIHKIAVDKTWSHGYSVQWVIGGTDVDVVVVNPYRSYAEMADPETPFLKLAAESLGSEQAARDLLKQFWGSLAATASYQIAQSRPDLSTQK